jgi:hypothetical protein
MRTRAPQHLEAPPPRRRLRRPPPPPLVRASVPRAERPAAPPPPAPAARAREGAGARGKRCLAAAAPACSVLWSRLPSSPALRRPSGGARWAGSAPAQARPAPPRPAPAAAGPALLGAGVRAAVCFGSGIVPRPLRNRSNPPCVRAASSRVRGSRLRLTLGEGCPTQLPVLRHNAPHGPIPRPRVAVAGRSAPAHDQVPKPSLLTKSLVACCTPPPPRRGGGERASPLPPVPSRACTTAPRAPISGTSALAPHQCTCLLPSSPTYVHSLVHPRCATRLLRCRCAVDGAVQGPCPAAAALPPPPMCRTGWCRPGRVPSPLACARL